MQAFSIRTFSKDWDGQPPHELHFFDEKNKQSENFQQPVDLPSPENIHPYPVVEF